MTPTRRALSGSLLLAPLLPLLRPERAVAQAWQPTPTPVALPVPAVVPPPPDMRAVLRQAAAAMPAANARGRAAVTRTLERLDDHGLDLSSGRVIVANIAAQELIAYQDGREALRSRIIVGTPRTRTPQLASFVTSVRANPPWYVPTSIEAELRAKGPSGITGFRVVGGRLIQPPGPTNPLGPLRIGLMDSDGIFLHGTNSPRLFASAGRTLSHGCVRVERVRDLAAWLLGITPAAVDAMVATGRTLERLPVAEVPVFLSYLTAWPMTNGRVAVFGDPYGYDQLGVRGGFRRVSRPVVGTPAEAEAAARPGPAADNPL
ncbi:L,D-transpeptidase family protein [Muricoccus radiodurans]|uniref:L,D-transpeptidase family protein n=1 Tax=Muricoccus radiodurans TaxID=2231721 RepID=UPI003CEA842F